jgi:hypothetical protein
MLLSMRGIARGTGTTGGSATSGLGRGRYHQASSYTVTEEK